MRRGLGHPDTPTKPPAPKKSPPRSDDAPLTVSELTRAIKTLLEGRMSSVAVAGEITGIKASPSGHVYFCLKDSGALIDCVIWRSTAVRIRNLPPDGARITVRGKLTVYEPRGRYQLVVASLVAGAEKGDLWQKFEELKNRLANEGLFDNDRKVPLPGSPKTIGIVTSPSGAALRDMLKILARRAPNVKIVVAPTPVQGNDAQEKIARAVAALDAWGGADVIVVGRGGGSMEDLWAFNGEAVARAIANAKTPIVSAVGHETDFTIADFVADARAATPSEAAERIAPDQTALHGRIRHAAVVLARALAGSVRERQEQLRRVASNHSFRKPEEMFNRRWQQLDLAMAELSRGVQGAIVRARSRRELAAARISGMSPLRVLERGYAVVLDANGKAVTDAAGLAQGDTVTTLLHRGKFSARVQQTEL